MSNSIPVRPARETGSCLALIRDPPRPRLSDPSPPTSRRQSPELQTKDANELEAQRSRRIALSYPFLLPRQGSDLGSLGDDEVNARDPLLLKDRVQETGKAFQRKRKVRDFYEDQNERISSLLKPWPGTPKRCAQTTAVSRRRRSRHNRLFCRPKMLRRRIGCQSRLPSGRV